MSSIFEMYALISFIHSKIILTPPYPLRNGEDPYLLPQLLFENNNNASDTPNFNQNAE